MKIEFKNIGTVKHAEIDLDKNLLIFCGPNNTGKTYVAYTLYGIYKPTKFSLDTMTDLITTTNGGGYFKIKLSAQLIKEILDDLSETVCENLGEIFASSQLFFLRSKLSIDLELTDEEINEKINNFTIGNKTISGFGRQYEVNKDQYSDIVSIRNKYELAEELDKKKSQLEGDIGISTVVKRLITNMFFGDSFIAPAERIAINIFSKEVFLNRAGLINNPISEKSRYSLPIAASLRVAEDLSFLEKTKSGYSAVAKLIEDKILLGSITVSPHGEMQFNPNHGQIKSLSINLAGSMVKSLASIVFYFRHLAQKGDFIIVDEPELNLHPDNQIIIARILARIVNEGFKVLISTHSDYIISELNNLVRLNSRKEKAKKIMDTYEYEKEELLDKDALGVYLFKKNVATSLEVDEFGFDISTIEKVNSDLAQTSESIYFDLFDKDDE